MRSLVQREAFLIFFGSMFFGVLVVSFTAISVFIAMILSFLGYVYSYSIAYFVAIFIISTGFINLFTAGWIASKVCKFFGLKCPHDYDWR